MPSHALLTRLPLSSLGATLVCAVLSACGGGGAGAESAAPAAGPTGTKVVLDAAVKSALPATAIALDRTLTVRAHGSLAAGVGPMMVVRINGTVVAEQELKAAEPEDHRIELPAGSAGVIELVLVNAGVPNSGLTRTLTIDMLTVGERILRPADVGVWFDAGDGAAAFDGLDIEPGRAQLTRNGALRFVLPGTAVAEVGTATDPTPAPGVYVDAQRGDDRAAGSFAAPWRTLSQLSNITLPVGHGIYLRCGSTWREALVLNSRQLADGSVIAGYGGECSKRKAIISGADDFSGGWRAQANGVWARSLLAGTPKITQLFVDGWPMRTAQWPNASAAAGSAASAVAGDSASTMRIAASTAERTLLTGNDLVGATVQLRTQPWLIETRLILGAVETRLELERAPDWRVDATKTFLLQDKQWMLDQPGEFFHDPATHTLYLIPPTGSAAAELNQRLIEGSVRDVAMQLADRSRLVVRDLGFHAARVDGLRMLSTPAALITQIQAHHNNSVGVHLSPASQTAANAAAGSVLQDSVLFGNGRYGIEATFVKQSQILRNHVLATGMGPQHTGGVIAGISAGPGGRTEGNVVDGAGYLGIHFSSRDGSVVSNNTVAGFCRRLTDCGGIYTWTGRNASGNVGGTRVVANRLMAGSADPTRAAVVANEPISGVYIDDFSNGATVQDNLVAGVPMGVFVHNASFTTVSGNRIWLPTQVALWASMDQTDGDWMVGNRFVDNEIVPLVTASAGPAAGLPSMHSSQAVWFMHAAAGEAALAASRNRFAGNVIIKLQGALPSHARLRGPGGDRLVDLDEWRTWNPDEPVARGTLHFAPYDLTLGPELVSDSRFEQGLAQWRTWQDPAGTGFSVQALTATVDCPSGCIRLVAATRSDLLASRAFRLRAGAPHVYRWSVRLPGTTGSSAVVGAPYVSRDGTPWDQMTTTQGFVSHLARRLSAGGMLDYEALFVAKSSDPARVNFQMDTPGVPVYLNTVSVREIQSLRTAQPSEWATVAVAANHVARRIECRDLGWPDGCQVLAPDGQAVPMPLTVPAGEQRLLLRGDSPLRR